MCRIIEVNNNKKDTILISGLVHGDEIVGKFVIKEFLSEIGKYPYNFVLFPEVNTTLQHLNKEDIDLNGDFIECLSKEVIDIKIKLLTLNKRYKFCIDIHEIPYDWTSSEFTIADNPHSIYLYETERDGNRIGQEVLLAADDKICDWPYIYKDKSVNGVIYPEGYGDPSYQPEESFDGYLFKYFSDHTFTTETPTIWPLERRVAAQLNMIRYICGQTIFIK